MRKLKPCCPDVVVPETLGLEDGPQGLAEDGSHNVEVLLVDAHALVLSSHLAQVDGHPFHVLQVVENLFNHLKNKKKVENDLQLISDKFIFTILEYRTTSLEAILLFQITF